jgi:serine phosphatase RsbU (regulator of sigma subunit)
LICTARDSTTGSRAFQHLIQSGLILDELRKEGQRALHQKSDSQNTKEGMDISLCIIDRTRNTIQYSGAFNNLYLIRNNELFEYRADRMPIGISGFSDKSFASQYIPAISGDLIYMFTDGYADQFGGPNGKKFKYATLKASLLNIHKLPLPKQKQKLEKEFNDWKGTSPQIDDVLILGLKI